MRNLSSSLLFVLLVAIAFVGCYAETAKESQPAADQASALPASEGLPEGHPPISGQPAPAVPMGSGPAAEGAGGVLVWTTPEGWVAEQPSSQMRSAQYRVSGSGGDAECVVFYFGAGQGGDPVANAQRWAGQFAQPDGSSSQDALRTETVNVGGIRVLLVRVKGTFQAGRGMGGPGEPRPGYALLGAVAEGPDASWFFKLTGPEKTVEEQSVAFRKLIDSLRAGDAA